MDKVTITKTRRAPRGRVKIYLDEGPSFSISSSVATGVSLEKGQMLSLAEVEKLKYFDNYHRCLTSAFNYIGPRPRSEMEIRTRLRHHRFDTDTIHKVINQLKQQGLVDDVAFARFWRENRENFRPRSRRLIQLELRQKGVNPDSISRATEDIDVDP